MAGFGVYSIVVGKSRIHNEYTVILYDLNRILLLKLSPRLSSDNVFLNSSIMTSYAKGSLAWFVVSRTRLRKCGGDQRAADLHPTTLNH
jgi:hypothetical protein